MQIEMTIKGLMVDPVTNMPIIILRDDDGNRVLPIWVGIFEANAIALQIENVAHATADDPRPAAQCHPGPGRRGAEGRRLASSRRTRSSP